MTNPSVLSGRSSDTTEAKQEAKRERLEERAERLKREAAARFNSGMERLRAIPFGQPILVGHYSEGRDRNYRRKAIAAVDKGIELNKIANEVAARAAAIGSGGVSSDDPDAVVKLKEKLEGLKAQQARMVAANKIVRKFKADIPAGRAALEQAGFPGSIAKGLFEPDFCGRVGFASYELTNNGANIRRIEQRIEQLAKQATRETKEIEVAGVRLVENADINRVQLFFPGKPSAEVRALLKQRGFRWAPSEGAWQRHFNGSGQWAARDILRSLMPDRPKQQETSDNVSPME